MAGRLDVLGSIRSTLAAMFGGKRDLARVLGYATQLGYDDYLARWARGDIAGRIIDIPAEATFSTLPRLTEDAKLYQQTALSDKFDRIAARVDLRRKLEKADKLAGIGRYATVLLGFADGKSLDQPVKQGAGGDVLFVQPFSEANSTPGDIDVDPKSETFGTPVNFNIDFSRGLSEADPSLFGSLFGTVTRPFSKGKTNKVHVSRLVHIAEGTLEDDIYGMPRLRRVWDKLDDLAKVSGASAEAFWLVANRGLVFNVDKDLQLDEKDKADLQKQFDEYQHAQRRMIRVRGIEVSGLNEAGVGNVNPSQVFRVIAALIVGTTGIPYRMLFGTERGQNISAGDRRAWLEQVGARREGFANEVVLRPFVERCVYAGILPVKANEAELFWPPVHDDEHQANVAATLGLASFNFAKAQQTGRCPIATGEFRSVVGYPAELPEDATDKKREADAQKQAKQAADAQKEAAALAQTQQPQPGELNGNGAQH